jgi:cell division protein FtsZ
LKKRRTNYFSFDLPFLKAEPVATRKREKVLFELTNETREMKVNQPVQFVPVTELSDNGIIKYSLEEYMEVENDFISSNQLQS